MDNTTMNMPVVPAAYGNNDGWGFGSGGIFYIVILFLFFAAAYNITVTVFGISGGADKKIRAMRRIKFRKQELVIKLVMH